MDCEQALALISARLDREILPSENEWLTDHLRGCTPCRATAEAFSLQHSELKQTFVPRRAAVGATADRVNASVAALCGSGPRRRRLLRPAVLIPAAVLLWFVVAIVLFNALGMRLWDAAPVAIPVPNVRTQPPAPTPPTVAMNGLTPRPLPKAVETVPLKEGQSVRTAAGERRRDKLPDGSIVFINENTSLSIDNASQVSLNSGTAYFEMAAGGSAPTPAGGFVLKTPQRMLVSYRANFAVSEDAVSGSSVTVAEGTVEALSPSVVSIQAGQVLRGNEKVPVSSPRLSHVLDWTRDLVAASETPLIPASSYDGGALIAVDANGQEAKLSLRKYRVDVHIEDGFARTTIDQTYFNHHPWRLEGTFYFPLPPDASLSRLAMYVDGDLNEGGMVEREYGRQVYDRIVNNNRDPALLEWVDGSTFKMRVFPLEGRQEKRLILSYTQRLSTLYGRSQYRFPAGHNLQMVRDWSFHALVKNGANYVAVSPTHPAMKRGGQGGDLVLDDTAENCKVDRDVVLDLTDPSFVAEDKDAVRFTCAKMDGNEYLMMRYRPQLPAQKKRERRDWIFLFESSADRDPLLARAQIEIVRGMLQNTEVDDTYRILAVSNRLHTFPSDNFGLPAGPPPPGAALVFSATVAPDNVAGAMTFLEQTHLVGALDLGIAFRTAEQSAALTDNPYLVQIGGGYTGMGTPQDELAKLLPAKAKYIGIGVGKHWNRAFMKQCAEQTGGYYTQINPDESIGWRTFELMATLNTPRLLDVKVADANLKMDDKKQLRWLLDNNAIAQGEELCAVKRLETTAPDAVTITGLLDGEKFERTVRVEKVTDKAAYIPRTWAKLEIDRLLAAKEALDKNKKTIIDLSKSMYVMTPFTSLLVLENEAMYKEFKVDRGRKDHWAMYACPDKIPVVYEPDPTMPTDVRNAPKGLKPTANQVLQSVCVRGQPEWFRQSRDSDRYYAGGFGPISRPVSLSSREKPPGFTFFLGFAEGAHNEETVTATGFAFAQPEFTYRGTRAFHNSTSSITPASTPPALPALYGTPRFAGLNWGNGANLNGTMVPGSDSSPDPVIFPSPALVRKKLNDRDYIFEGIEDYYDYGKLGVQLNRPHSPAMDSGLPRSGQIDLTDHVELATHIIDDNWSQLPDKERAKLVREFTSREQGNNRNIYHRLSYTNASRLFTDLLAYAPGLNTSEADILAIVEAEAMPDIRQAPGHITDDARKLIDSTRTSGWHKLTLPSDKDQPEQVILFDAAGRYTYEYKPAVGLREIVVCDGTTLVHQYPEIGLAGRRTVSRFHRAELTGLLPWLLPPAEDLARGVDLECVDANTIALVPHWLRDARKSKEEAPLYRRLQLVIKDHRLAERQLVEMPAQKIVAREVFDGKGGVRLLDAAGKEVSKFTRQLSAADAPNMRPDLSALVVLPLPYRSRTHVMDELYLKPSVPLADEDNGCFINLDTDDSVKLLTSLVAEQNTVDAQLLYRFCFAERGDKRLGLFTLLSAAGVDVSREPAYRQAFEANSDDQLLQYLGLCGNAFYKYFQQRLPLHRGRSAEQGGSFFRELADAQALLLRWQSPNGRMISWHSRPGDVQRSIAFIGRHQKDVLGQALLYEMQDRTEVTTDAEKDQRNQTLAEQWGRIADANGGAYRARYEQAWSLTAGHKRPEAEKLLKELYAKTLDAGVLPPIDSRFKNGLQSLDKQPIVDEWNPLIRKTAERFLEKKQYGAVLALASQCRSLGETALADTLLNNLLAGIRNQPAWQTTLAVTEFYLQANDLARADALLQPLLSDKQMSQYSGIWRMARNVADRRGRENEAVADLEKALDLEYQNLPEVIDLTSWRRDYEDLLSHYLKLAKSAKTLNAPMPADLSARTMRAVDRWRAHDPEASGACKTAAKVFATLDNNDLAWDYYTTALLGQGLDVSSWQGMAIDLNQVGAYELADRALAVAADVDPANAEVVWERARNLRQANRLVEADGLMRRLANEKWPARYQGIRANAQEYVRTR